MGQEPDPTTGSIVAPIYQTSTYVQEALGKNKGYDYARTNHPNRKALERCRRETRRRHGGVLFSSGHGGDRFCVSAAAARRPRDSLGIGLWRRVPLDDATSVQFGMEFSLWIPLRSTKCARAEAEHENDLRRDADQPHDDRHRHRRDGPSWPKERNLTLVVDNTFLSPYLQQPIALGAHIVVHSMTKYLNGHSDCTGGAVILSRKEDAEKIYFLQRSAGAGLAPMDCFLVSRGIKTLAVRMEQHDANGMAVAKYLEAHPKVKRVRLSGPAFASAARHCETPAARFRRDDFLRCGHSRGCAQLAESREAVFAGGKFGRRGDVDFPSGAHDARFDSARCRRLEIGITDGLIRISVGIEDVEDLIADLDQALEAV